MLVRDVTAGTTELVSRGAGPGGAQAAGQSSGTPAISGNGQCVAFETTADSFTPMPRAPITGASSRGRSAATARSARCPLRRPRRRRVAAPTRRRPS